jgi:zinc transport system ATP-binding protein
MEHDPVVTVDHVTFSYDGSPAIEDVSLRVERDDFVAIIGPNGGGKTTLLRIMLGLLIPQTGTVKVFGQPPHMVRTRIGYMPQYASLDLKFPVNVMDVVLLGRLGKTRGFGPFSHVDKEAAQKALEELELLDLKNRPFSRLSGGQRQRALIARAIVGDPELLLLDEPTASLDAQVEAEFYELLRKLNERLTIVMVSHDLGVVSKYVKNVVCVKLRAVSHPTDKMSGDMLKDIYGSDMCIVRHDQEVHAHEVHRDE